ncbi:MAG TPA: flagellar export chaperone FliS [Symbiobacteriaceae bacterium]
MVNALNQYRSYQTETSSPEDQVALLYDGARRFTDKATAALEAGVLDQASYNVGRAQAILTQLSAALNFDTGEIAQNLWKLYDYWEWRLSEGLIKREPAALREVSATLMDMQSAWAEAARQVRIQRGMRSLG